jgi:hypothetical protein
MASFPLLGGGIIVDRCSGHSHSFSKRSVRIARFVRHTPLAALGIIEARKFYMAHTAVFINAKIARVSAHFHHTLFKFI